MSLCVRERDKRASAVCLDERWASFFFFSWGGGQGISLGRRLTVGGDDDGDDEAIDTKHTSHDHGDDGLHDELGTHHTHGRDTDARLGSSVSRTHACAERSRGEEEGGN